MSLDGRLLFARHDAIVFVRLEGRATQRLGPDLDHFLATLCQRADFADVVVDLSNCVALDSTVMGLLARLAKWTRGERRPAPTVLCPQPKVAATLRGVGLDRLVNVVTDLAIPLPAASAVSGVEMTKPERARMILQAHRELVSLNEENAAQFKSVVQFLEQELSEG